MLSTFKKYYKLIGIILFIYILSRIDLLALFQTLKEVNFPYFFLGGAFLFPSIIVRIFRWRVLINSVGINTPFKMTGTFFLKSIFLGIVTPGRVGEFWRAKYLTESTPISLGKAFYTTLADKIVALLIIMLMGATGALTLFWLFKMDMLGLIIFVGIFLALIIFFLIKKEMVEKTFRFFLRTLIPNSQKDRASFFLDEFYQGIRTLKILPASRLLALVILEYFIGVSMYYFVSLSLGLFLPFWYFFLIIGLVWLSIFLPITVFGLGTREASLIFFFSIFGIVPAQAVAFSLLVLLYDMIVAIPGLILFLKQK